jgi:hypothetical protein
MEQKPPMFKSAMNYGAIIGLVLVGLSLVSFLIGDYENKVLQYASYFVMVGGLFWAIKSYRDNECGGLISYGSVLGFGTMVSLFFGILTAFFMYIYLKFVDDTLLQYVMEESARQMEAKGMSDEEIEVGMEYSRMFTSAGFFGTMALLGNVFFGFIISLVLGFILKKEDETFN